MKTKWYFGTLIFILALLGVSHQEADVPNQEIIVQFTGDEVTPDATQNAIAIVRDQLQAIGVDNIQVHESEDGKLKITYYSDIDVAGIQKILSKEQGLALDYMSYDQDESSSSFPSEEDSNGYKLNVSEIQKGYDAESDFNGFLAESIPDNERLYYPYVHISGVEIDTRERNNAEKTAYLVHNAIAMAIDNSSHNIPEVRAGPASSGNMFTI